MGVKNMFGYSIYARREKITMESANTTDAYLLNSTDKFLSQWRIKPESPANLISAVTERDSIT